jgi:hypothetical protein
MTGSKVVNRNLFRRMTSQAINGFRLPQKGAMILESRVQGTQEVHFTRQKGKPLLDNQGNFGISALDSL